MEYIKECSYLNLTNVEFTFTPSAVRALWKMMKDQNLNLDLHTLMAMGIQRFFCGSLNAFDDHFVRVLDIKSSSPVPSFSLDEVEESSRVGSQLSILSTVVQHLLKTNEAEAKLLKLIDGIKLMHDDYIGDAAVKNLIFGQCEVLLKLEDHSDAELTVVTKAVREPFHELFAAFKSVSSDSRKPAVPADPSKLNTI
jgi:hypothetical protein